MIVYLWEVGTGGLDSDQSLVAHGAMWGPAVHAGEWWRIFTSAFLHGGLTHIGFNMFALWQVGTYCELIYGPWRMFVLYVISTVGSGAAVYLFNYNVPTVGASGAIFGLFGALAAAGLQLGAEGRGLVQQTIGVVVINLLIGFSSPNISNAGHIGGVVTGFLAGLLAFMTVKRRRAHVLATQAVDDAADASLADDRRDGADYDQQYDARDVHDVREARDMRDVHRAHNPLGGTHDAQHPFGAPDGHGGADDHRGEHEPT